MILAEVSLGVRSITDAGMFMALSGHSSFSPISFGQGDNLVQGTVSTLMPTFLKPGTEVAFNSTYFGGKVYQSSSHLELQFQSIRLPLGLPSTS